MQFQGYPDHYMSAMFTMNKFREDSSLCDVMLMIGSQRVLAHRCVLAAGSDYFNTLFLGQFAEADMKEINLTEVTNNISALEKIVNYIYTGDIVIDEEDLEVIIQLSSFFLMENLRDICCEFMTEKLSLETCIKYYLLSLDFGLFVGEVNAGSVVQSRFHDYFIYEDSTLELSSNEMKTLVEKNILQHCSNASIVRFIALWVNKGHTEPHVLLAKSIFDDLIQREQAPKFCSLEMTETPSGTNLYQMIESSLSEEKIENKDLFLNSFKQVLKRIKRENEMYHGKMKLRSSQSGKETAIITLSPSSDIVEKRHSSEEWPVEVSGHILDMCAYIPRTKSWYHLRKLYAENDKMFTRLVTSQKNVVSQFHMLHDDLIFVNVWPHEDVDVIDLNTFELCELKTLPYNDFNRSYVHPSPMVYSRELSIASGKNKSQYIVSKFSRFEIPAPGHGLLPFLAGIYFTGYKCYEGGQTLQTQFQTESFDDLEWNRGCTDMYTKISSLSNEMIVVHSGDDLNVVFVVDLNQDEPSPVTLLSTRMSRMSQIDMGIAYGTQIVESNNAMYIVTDGTTSTSGYKGNAKVMYEYILNSQQLTEVNSTEANLGQLHDTYRYSDAINLHNDCQPKEPCKYSSHPYGYNQACIHSHIYDSESFPCLHERSASVDDGLWYIEGNDDKASFLTKVSVDEDKNPVMEQHTPPPFPYITAMFASKISSQILENKKPVTKFFGKELTEVLYGT